MSKGIHRKLGIDDVILKKSKNVIIGALMDGKQLTRSQLLPFFKNKQINTDDIRLGFLLMDAELDGLICSGARQGKQFTYALLAERVLNPVQMDKEASLAELAKKYFLSRGPATVHDFSWWSGLNLTDSKKGLEMNKSILITEVVNGQAYWFSPAVAPSDTSDLVKLLPSFDEYAIAYKDRADFLAPQIGKQSGNGIFKPIVVIDGLIQGTWTRSFHKEKIHLEVLHVNPAIKFSKQTVISAAQMYGDFSGMELSISITNKDK